MADFNNEEYEQAIAEFEGLISKEPQNPYLYNNIGAVYYKKRD